jgi:hypothetical protein
MPPRKPASFGLALIAAACLFASGGPSATGAWAGATGSDPSTADQGGGVVPIPPPGDPLNPCERAGIAAEQMNGLPAGLLLAIGRVESGRWDPARRRMTAWPWTINAAGRGQWFDTKDEAARSTGALLDSGVRSIDVGCFQISLLWHPLAFTNLEQAFDPDANARYAAHFLVTLLGQTGSWEAAVEAYHSADPALGFAYRQQVFSTWSAAAPLPFSPMLRSTMAPMLASASRPIAMPVVIAGVQVWTPMPAGTAAGVVTMPGSPASDLSRAQAGNTAPLPVVSYRMLPASLISRR